MFENIERVHTKLLQFYSSDEVVVFFEELAVDLVVVVVGPG
jgi:hypothetical protein